MMEKDCLIIFTHGIAEGPQVFSELARLCEEEGYATEAITLPGHCCACREFANTKGDLWLEHLLSIIAGKESDYKNIILVGHSLGSILSILASDASDKIKGIILINAPLSVRVLPRAVVINLTIGLGLPIKPGDMAWAASQSIAVGRGKIWEYVGWIPRIRDLFRFIDLSLQKLPHVNAPILAIHSDKDELVGPKTVRLFKNLAQENNCEIIRLPNSTHFDGPSEDRDLARSSIMEMIRRCLKPD